MIENQNDLLESFAKVGFPQKTDARLHWLMDRNSAGILQHSELEEMEALVELSENLSLLRAKALRDLGRRPKE